MAHVAGTLKTQKHEAHSVTLTITENNRVSRVSVLAQQGSPPLFVSITSEFPRKEPYTTPLSVKHTQSSYTHTPPYETLIFTSKCVLVTILR